MMRKIFALVICILISIVTFAQMASSRTDFFNQEMESIIRENRKNNGIIFFADQRIRWDTTEWTIKRYLTEFDSLENSDLGARQRPTQEIIDGFDEVDYQAFREQIANQDKDSFIKERKVKGDSGGGKINPVLTVRFSQPLVSHAGTIIVVQEQIDSRYCFTNSIWIFKRIGSKWTKTFELKRTEICE